MKQIYHIIRSPQIRSISLFCLLGNTFSVAIWVFLFPVSSHPESVEKGPSRWGPLWCLCTHFWNWPLLLKMYRYLFTPKGDKPNFIHLLLLVPNPGSIIYSTMTQMKTKIYLPSTDNLAIKMAFLKIKGF